ncbi:MAG TPA: DUF2252 domain-containing protein [Ktedonobacteraceae bacterium]|nr:DUF2252 domain-containing protein [Ktedonobacteraceae bacterium]
MNRSTIPFLGEQNAPTIAERRAAGKALRTRAPRASHATWSPAPDRPDPISLLEESNRSRIAALVPLRYGRMITSPFAFLRGSAVVMAGDLAMTPNTGIQVQACGDAHLSNFGTYATPERNQVFDVNDFDETLPGPWEWDVKRLAASIVLAGRQNSFSIASNRQAVLNCLQTYRERMWEFADMCHLDVWYSCVDAQSMLKRVGRTSRPLINRELEKAHRQTSSHVFPLLARHINGQYSIKDDPPLITHLDDEQRTLWLHALLGGYEASLSDDRRVLFNRYRVVDLAQKVVGVGSVGTHCYIALLLGNADNDPLFLQIKEAQASVLEQHLGTSAYPNHAQRVLCGQHLMQAASDIFLGWTSGGSIDCYIRQLRDMKGTPSLVHLVESDFIVYAGLCGWTLARAHARSGDSASISGYLGTNDQFDRAVATFAQAYADQTERDHAALVAAAHAGRVPVETIK